MLENEVKLKSKIILLGDTQVGKTSLIRRYVLDVFSDKYKQTIGTKVSKKNINVKVENVMVQITLLIWDILGQLSYEQLHASYYRGAAGIIYVSDITNISTLENIPNWVARAVKIVGWVPQIFIVNKSDLRDYYQFSFETACEFLQDFGNEVILTSAKTGENVNKAFHRLARQIIQHQIETGAISI